jgi:hypothetical protein
MINRSISSHIDRIDLLIKEGGGRRPISAGGGRRRGRRTGTLNAVVAVVVGTAAVVLFDPTRRHVALCPFHALTGWQCPLCGSLRAVDELAHGHLAAAVRDNVLFVAVLPVLAVLWIDRLRRPVRRRTPRALVVATIAVAAGFTVVRNLPWATALRP